MAHNIIKKASSFYFLTSFESLEGASFHKEEKEALKDDFSNLPPQTFPCTLGKKNAKTYTCYFLLMPELISHQFLPYTSLSIGDIWTLWLSLFPNKQKSVEKEYVFFSLKKKGIEVLFMKEKAGDILKNHLRSKGIKKEKVLIFSAQAYDTNHAFLLQYKAKNQAVTMAFEKGKCLAYRYHTEEDSPRVLSHFQKQSSLKEEKNFTTYSLHDPEEQHLWIDKITKDAPPSFPMLYSWKVISFSHLLRALGKANYMILALMMIFFASYLYDYGTYRTYYPSYIQLKETVEAHKEHKKALLNLKKYQTSLKHCYKLIKQLDHHKKNHPNAPLITRIDLKNHTAYFTFEASINPYAYAYLKKTKGIKHMDIQEKELRFDFDA
jgi:hypothetical protein